MKTKQQGRPTEEVLKPLASKVDAAVALEKARALSEEVRLSHLDDSQVDKLPAFIASNGERVDI